MERFKHEKDMDILDRKFAAIDLDIKANQTRIDGILKIAKAESEEEGQQIDQYNRYLDQLMAAETQLMQQKRDMFDQRQQLKAQKEQEQAAAQQQAAQPAQ